MYEDHAAVGNERRFGPHHEVRVGELLARSAGADVIDAALVLLADDGDDLVTSDPRDLEPLAALAERHVELVRT